MAVKKLSKEFKAKLRQLAEALYPGCPMYVALSTYKNQIKNAPSKWLIGANMTITEFIAECKYWDDQKWYDEEALNGSEYWSWQDEYKEEQKLLKKIGVT